ncbi:MULTISPECIES: TetR/AcrR family transcriptional regulator [Aeromicrobium]|uniref:TetR/AcrR family transcriptional regulator n=1 Tax=Aeromicrobium TaxID=2040 RepID=UPI00257A91A1|nr:MULTISPECIES: TetR/AcrR family transcriptional regulator [Aeromicrobium]
MDEDADVLGDGSEPAANAPDEPLLKHPSVVKEVPTTVRGRRTRDSLIAGAKIVFARDGYIGARLTDITVEAGCSTGTFYTYFTGKEEVMAAVVNDVLADMMRPGVGRLRDVETDPISTIRAAHQAYFESYQRNAGLMVAFEQASTVDPHFAEMRAVRGDLFGRRNARRIREFQERGLVNPDLDPYLIALALNAMVSRMAHRAIALKSDIDLDQLLDVVTELWANALGLARYEGPA